MFDYPLVIQIAIGLAILAVLGVGVWQLVAFLRRRRLRPDRYFVRRLSDEQTAALGSAKVQFTKSDHDGEPGVLFERKYLKAVLRTLSASVEYCAHINAKTHEAVLTFRVPEVLAKRFGVTVEGQIKHGRREIERIVRNVLLPSLHSNIVVHVTPGRNINPIHDKKFHIFFSHAPGVSDVRNVPKILWGIPTQADGSLYTTSEAGVPVFDGHSNFPVAELIENCLYITVPVGPRLKSSGAEFGLLVRILQAALTELHAESYLSELIAILPAVRANAPEQTYNVVDKGFTARRQLVVTSLVKGILCPAVGADVLLVHCKGKAKAPAADGKFRILYQGAAAGKRYLSAPTTLFGHGLRNRQDTFGPSGGGLPLVDDQGNLYGELVGKNLYLFNDSVLHGSRDEAALLARLLYEAAREIVAADGGVEVSAQRWQSLGWQQVQAAQAAGAGGNYTVELRAASAEFHRRVRQAGQAEVELFQLEASPTDELGREFDELASIRKVVGVTVNQNYVAVFTDLLYCVDPRTGINHEIGAFEIRIPTDKSADVRWYNQTRRVYFSEQKMHAPHVDKNGKGCLGTTKAEFPDLIGKRQFAAAVQLAIAFVESVNVSDRWGTHINKFPIAHG